MPATYQQLLFNTQTVPLTLVYTTSGAGSVTTPTGFTSVTVESIGGGGNGFGSNTANNRASGGGGQYAISDPNIAVTGGTTIVYYSVGSAATDSWVNVGTNSAPSAKTSGCLSKAGTSASSGSAGSGSQAGSIGATTRNGGNGATGTNSAGGGGAGASSAGSGSTAGGDTTLLSPAQLMGGGTGGAYNSGTGTAPGGGGGAASTNGTVLAGAVGRVRVTFYP